MSPEMESKEAWAPHKMDSVDHRLVQTRCPDIKPQFRSWDLTDKWAVSLDVCAFTSSFIKTWTQGILTDKSHASLWGGASEVTRQGLIVEIGVCLA